MTTHCDVLVIGAGPAGSAAARRCAQSGARTLLVEKRHFPRPKLCGGWVSERALSAIGTSLPEDIAENPFLTASLRFGPEGSEYTPTRPLGVFVDRAVFDAHLARLAQDAGAELICASARSVTHEDGVCRVSTGAGEFRADSVVIATGANAALTESCRPADRKSWRAVCLEQRLSSYWADQLHVRPGEARLYFGSVHFGFGWILHHGPYLLIGIGGRCVGSLEIRRAFDRFWQSLGLPEELQAPKGHHIPLGGFPRRLGAGRMLCAGDAAGMVDAFSGEGIANAIESGHLAAEALMTAEADEPATVYARACRRQLLPELRHSLWTARLFHAAPSVFVRAFCRDPKLLNEYHDVMQRQSTYSRLLRRAVRHLLSGAATGQSVKSYEPARNRATHPNAHPV